MKKIFILILLILLVCACEKNNTKVNTLNNKQNNETKEEDFFDKTKKKENKLSCMLTTPVNDEITGLRYYEVVYFLYFNNLENEREKPYMQRVYSFVFETEQKRKDFFNSTAFEELTSSLKEDIEELNLEKGYIKESAIDRDSQISLHHMVKFDNMETFKMYYDILKSEESNYICYTD